jgi:hypothetical protein
MPKTVELTVKHNTISVLSYYQLEDIQTMMDSMEACHRNSVLWAKSVEVGKLTCYLQSRTSKGRMAVNFEK